MPARKSKERGDYYIKPPREKPVEVSGDLYNYWYTSRRRLRYQKEAEKKIKLTSLDELCEKYGDHAPELMNNNTENTSEWVIPEQIAEQNFEYGRLYQELQRLPPEEKNLLFSLFFECVSLRELAKRKGVCHKALIKQRDRILAKLAKMLRDIE